MSAGRVIRRLSVVLWLSTAATPGHAQQSTHADEAALAVAVSARLTSTEWLRGQFIQEKQVSGFRKPLVSTGDFLLWRGHGLLWQTRTPFASTLVLARDRLSAVTGEAGVRTDASQAPALHTINALILALLAGDVSTLRGHFTLDGELAAEGGWQLVLAPRDPVLAQRFRRFELVGDRYVRQVRIEEIRGDLSIIRFERLAANATPSPEEVRELGR